MTGQGECKCTRPKCSDLGLGGVPPTTFVKLQCRIPFAVLLVYRLVVTLYFWGYFLYNLILSVRPGGYYGGYYFIYLTNWGYILMLVYFTCALWNALAYIPRACCSRTSGWSDDGGSPWYFFPRGQWLLFNMYASAAIMITLLYWGALYVPGVVNLYYDINFHLLNGVFAMVEVLLTATVVRLLHFVYPFAFATAYVLFSVIYWAAGGKDEEGNSAIYSILDYGAKPALAAGLAVGAMLASVVVHILLVWGIHRLKMLIFAKCCPSCLPEDDDYDNEREGMEMGDKDITV